MTTETLSRAESPERVRPTPEQLERKREQLRFTRRRVWLPVGSVTLLWLLAIVGLLWLTVAGSWFHVDTNQETYRTLVSGAADAVIILSITPLLLLCALPSVAILALAVQRRRKEPEGRSWTESARRLLWRVENGVTAVRERLDKDVLPSVARPVTSAYALAAFARTLWKEVAEMISLEKWTHDDE